MTAVRKIAPADSPERQARVELAATFRLANRLGWNEGIANHFSVRIAPDRYLLNPYELHFREITASNLLVVDGKGEVISGEGQVRRVAFYLHPRLHTLLPRATAIIHAHPPYGTAICCVKGGRLDLSSAHAMLFAKQVCYDDEMGGPVDEAELQRILRLVGDKTIIMHAMHGVTTLGATIADAFDNFYFLEHWARATVLSRQMGQPTHRMSDDLLWEKPDRDLELTPRAQQAHLNAWMRVLDREEPDYKS
jgi:ribulose-5-phosphate 4-epimerase/fuculose-1-phosphate aldolase